MTAESGLRKRVLESIVVVIRNHAVIDANSDFILEKSESDRGQNTKRHHFGDGFDEGDLLTGNAMK